MNPLAWVWWACAALSAFIMFIQIRENNLEMAVSLAAMSIALCAVARTEQYATDEEETEHGYHRKH